MKNNACFAAILGIIALCAAPILVCLPGCAFLQKNVTPASLQAACSAAAYAGASVRLSSHPDDAPRFALAVAALDLLIADGHFDPVSLHTALSTLPVDALHGDTGTIIIDAAVVLFQTITGGKTPLEQAPYVQAAAKGCRNGLAMALPGATVLPLVMSNPLADHIGDPINILANSSRTITLHPSQAVAIGKVTYWNGDMPCTTITGCTKISKALWIVPPGCRLTAGTITIVGVK